MKGKVAAIVVGALLPVAVAATPAAAHVPTPTGKQGCTPGFWKNNLLAWESTAPNVYSPSTRLGSVFRNVPRHLANATFLDALRFKGNLGPEARLLRQAVAALLGTVHFDVAFPIGDEGQLIGMVNAALAGVTNPEVVKDQLDRWNNLGCPLSAKVDY